MSMGLPPNDPTPTTPPPAGSGAPARLPAVDAIALLRECGENDPVALGRLAYQLLTGVEPGDDTPTAPADLVSGFPPFASEVLMRALAGPDERRPTARTLLVVLETVPPGSWPAVAPTNPGPPTLTVVDPIAEPEAAPTHASEREPAPVAVADPVPDAVDDPAEPDTAEQPEPTPASPQDDDRTGHDESLRKLLRPSATIPQFDPLTAPWDADSDGLVAGNRQGTEDPAPETVEPSHERVAALPPRPLSSRLADARQRAEEAPRGMHEEFRGLVAAPETDEPRATPAEAAPQGMHEEFRGLIGTDRLTVVDPQPASATPEPAADPVPEASTEAATPASAEPQIHPSVAAAVQRDLHDEFRGLVTPPRAIPHFDQLDDALPDPGPRRRRSRASRKHSVTTYDDDGDRRYVVVLVVIVLALVVLGIVYAATRDASASSSGDDGTPQGQGASRSITQSG